MGSSSSTTSINKLNESHNNLKRSHPNTGIKTTPEIILPPDSSGDGSTQSNIRNRSKSPRNRVASKNDLDVDRSVVVGKLQREKTMGFFEIPKYPTTDEIIWETFYHKNGETFNCMYQSGERFILNLQTQEKHPFPNKLYKEGLIVTEDSKPKQSESVSGSVGVAGMNEDDRSGSFMHPTRGKIQTYIFDEKINVHRYYDKEAGSWLKMPMSWELRSEVVKNLMAPVQETLPDWQDKFDILASLRLHSYDPQQTIATFFSWGDMASWYVPTKAGSGTSDIIEEKDELIEKLKEKLKELNNTVNKQSAAMAEEKNLREKAEKQVEKLSEQLAGYDAEQSSLLAKCQALSKNRPKTAAMKQGICEVDKHLLKTLNTSLKKLHKDQAQLENEFNSSLSTWKSILSEVVARVKRIYACDSNMGEELEEMKNLYRREALQRKLLYNELQELRGNIRVFFRCRFDSRTQCCLKFISDTDVVAPNNKKPFSFDKVFTPQSTQEEVYEDTKPIIMSCVDGYNVCILAYGQTGSGKTYTMQGPTSDPGVNVRSLKELLNICNERENVSYNLKASMIEIYNETIHDLLNDSVNMLEIRTQGSKILMPGMIEMEVTSLQDIDQIMKLGSKNRTVAATKMNSQSSRSHLVFMVTVEGQDKTTGARSTGTLTLCDLAGSERVSKTEATGQRLVEAAAINKSLSSLGQVFTALKTGQLHIPYRNSKLTHILQPSLGGDAKACLFVMVSPDIDNLSETTSTMQFGSNAQQVQLGQAKKNISNNPRGH